MSFASISLIGRDTREFIETVVFGMSDNLEETAIYLYSNTPQRYEEKTNKKTFLKKLRIPKYFKCNNNKLKCTICLENVKGFEFIRALHCNHKYHKKCIDNWLHTLYLNDEILKCPLCRKTVYRECG